MTVIFQDAFTEASDTNLEDHTPDTGASWSLGAGTGGNAFVRSSDNALQTIGGAVAYYESLPAAGADAYVQARLKTLGGWLKAAVCVRIVDADNWIGFVNAGSGALGLRLAKTVGGVLNDNLGVRVQGAVDDVVKVTAVGTTIRMYVNDIECAGSPVTITDFETETSQGITTEDAVSSPWIDDYEAGDFIVASDEITLNEFGVGQVIQRNPSTSNASVTIAGTYSGSPVSIRYRILDASDDTTEISTWATLDASPSGGAFSEVVTVPEGGWYHAEVDFSDDATVTDRHSNDWGVGMIVPLWGQSQMENWVSDFTGTGNGLISVYDAGWAKLTTAGAGAISFANTVSNALSIPVAVIDSGVGGTQLGGGTEWGDDTSGSVYDDAIQQLAAVGNSCEFVLWDQGERDAIVLTSEANYTTALETLITTRLRGIVTNGSDQTNLPFLIGQLGNRTGGVTDAGTQAIKNALLAVADGAVADVYLAATMNDLPRADTVHLTEAGYTTHGIRFAQCVLDILGVETYHRGPRIDSATPVSTTVIDVTLTHIAGTDFTPTTGITGFEVLDDGTPVTISSAVRQDASTIRLTLSSATIGAVTVRYQYGADPNVSGAVLDNTSLALPMEGRDSFAAAAATSPVTKDYSILWNALNSINADSTTRWDALNAVEKDATIICNVLNSTEIDSTIRWNALNAITQDAALLFNVLNSVELDSSVKWDALNEISKDSTLIWNIESSLQAVEKDLTIRWDAFGYVRRDFSTVWNALNTVQRDSSILWDALNAIEIDADLKWDVLNSIAKDISVLWDVEGLTAVTKDLSLKWSVLNETETDLTLRWQVEGEGLTPDFHGNIAINSLTKKITISSI